jgi:signal transduction histidine kinase
MKRYLLLFISSIVLFGSTAKPYTNINQPRIEERTEMQAGPQLSRTDALVLQRERWRMILIIVEILVYFVSMAIYIMRKRTLQKKLKLEKIKAEEAEQTKSLFFQNMNHEIRSPLNAIIGFNDVLCSENADEIPVSEKNEIINMISTNSNLLITLVNDVLNLSNLESGSYRLTWNDTDIRHLCHTTLESIKGKQADGVELRLECDPDAPYKLYTDAQRLQQILINFLTNACKYTEKGSITLSYAVITDIVRFAVTDTGCGIKPEDSETVFERFRMLDKSKNGVGLGLHICKIISGLLHGKVYVDKLYRKGARFIFDHPVSKFVMILVLCVCSHAFVSGRNHDAGNRKEQPSQTVSKDWKEKQDKLIADKTRYQWSVIGILTATLIVAIILTVTYFQSKEKKLKREAMKAHEKEEYKNEFFINMNNEIRKPLDNIVKLNRQMNDTDNTMTKKEKKVVMCQLHDSADHLNYLVNGILNISKLESGTYKPKISTIVIGDLCAGIVQDYKFSVARNIIVQLDTDKNDCNHATIESDKSRLSAALDSYIRNACSHTDNGIVSLAYRLCSDSVNFYVTSTGNADIHNNYIALGLRLANLTADILGGKAYTDKELVNTTRYVLNIPIKRKIIN